VVDQDEKKEKRGGQICVDGDGRQKR